MIHKWLIKGRYGSFIDHARAGQITTIRREWQTVCDEAALSTVDRDLFWRRQFLNPFAFEGAPEALSALLE